MKNQKERLELLRGMVDLKDQVPTEFYNQREAKCDHAPRVETVGDLIKELERLPKHLPLTGWPEDYSHEVIVCNISCDNAFVLIEEVDL